MANATTIGCRVLLAMVCAVPAVAAAAEKIYKCTDAQGAVSYQKQPCPQGRREEEKHVDPNRNVIQLEVPPPAEPSGSYPTFPRDELAPPQNAGGRQSRQGAGGSSLENIPPPPRSPLDPVPSRGPAPSPSPPPTAPVPSAPIPQPPGSSAF